MRAAVIVFFTLVSAATTTGQVAHAGERYSGSASLQPGSQTSADQRFALKAELHSNRTQSGGRFALTARLASDAKGNNVICGVVSDVIFADGFEILLGTN